MICGALLAQQARDCRAVAMVTWFSNRDLWQQLKYTLRLTCNVTCIVAYVWNPYYWNLYTLPVWNNVFTKTTWHPLPPNLYLLYGKIFC